MFEDPYDFVFVFQFDTIPFGFLGSLEGSMKGDFPFLFVSPSNEDFSICVYPIPIG